SALEAGAQRLADRVYAERVRLFYKQQTATVGASFVIAALLTLLLWQDAGPSPRLIGWISVMAFVQACRLVLRLLFARAEPGIESAPVWARLAIALTTASGICWGA